MFNFKDALSSGLLNGLAPALTHILEDDNGNIQVELRSARESIVHIARKYGGGGHALACGCTLDSFEEIDKVLKDLNDFSGGIKNG